jgi:hypothetical protein
VRLPAHGDLKALREDVRALRDLLEQRQASRG